MGDISNSTSSSSSLNSEFYNKTHFNETTDVDDRIYEEIARLTDLISRPVIVVFGTVGNLLSFYVMRRGSLREVSTCFYMSILALADTGVLWTNCFIYWIVHLTDWKVNPDLWTDCKFGYFLFYFSTHYSSTLLVMMSIEKFFALYFPLKTKSICTVKTAKWATSIAALILFVFDGQLFFVMNKKINASGNEYCTFVGVPRSYTFTFNRIDSVLYSFAPFAVMCLVNSAIIYKFMAAKCHSSQEGIESTNQALSKSATKGTAMLITVSITFIALTGPVAFTYVIKNSPSNLLYLIIVMMSHLNHSINAVLYCIVGSRFRAELMKTLCCKSNRSLRYERSSTQRTTCFTISS